MSAKNILCSAILHQIYMNNKLNHSYEVLVFSGRMTKVIMQNCIVLGASNERKIQKFFMRV